MATSENNCIDNYSLPQGPAGPQGTQGLQGPTGPIGLDGAPGPQGRDGKNKIDINIQGNDLPYSEITTTASTEVDVAYFIFPGTTTFTPVTAFKIMTSLLAYSATTTIRCTLYEISTSGATTSAGSVDLELTSPPVPLNQHKFMIGTCSQLSLPTSEAMMKVTVQFLNNGYNPGNIEARIYAFEMR
ncbi:hypothetical protein CMI37_02455 [Candidatus Pacearchaeota archaeon]|nr:hypothetical protein [Candidatus Pacearchaeota archaeon]|tara:strand:+ start:11891 stop:12448 length:558 start_codon:yes stop_codon:yes gene_type:complete